MKTKLILTNILKIFIIIILLALSASALQALIIVNEIPSYLPLQDMQIPLNNPVTFLVLLGMGILLLLMGITFLLCKPKSIDSLFHWTILYLAFIPVTDLKQLMQLLNKSTSLTVDFDIIHNIYLLSEFPKDLILFMIIMYCMLNKDKIKLRKRDAILYIICLISSLAMLFLPELSGLMLFFVAHIIIFMAHGLFEQCNQNKEKRYEKVIMNSIVIIFVGKCLYRALVILTAYADVIQ